MSLEQQRREYLYGVLCSGSLKDDPFDQFGDWLDAAVRAEISDPTAMTLATVDSAGHPWQRIVLLKRFDQRGLVFFTNFGSRKAREIEGQPMVSLLFPWFAMDRQVVVGGAATRLGSAESAAYFASRPRESQLAAWASHQSQPLQSRRELESRFSECEQRFAGGPVPLPPFWGGYLVKPERFEFWQGGVHRLHDRFEYRRDSDGNWRTERLSP